MTATDLIGWAAAAMTLMAFTSREVCVLRLASLGASVAFITYAMATATWPVLALHSVLLPVNLLRLRELRRASLPPDKQPQQAHRSMTCTHGKAPPRASRQWHRLAVLAFAVGVASSAVPATAASTYADRMHARAVDPRKSSCARANGR